MDKIDVGEQPRNSLDRGTTRRSFLKTGAAAGLGLAAFSVPYISVRSASASDVLSFWALGYTSDPRSPTGKWFLDLAQAWNAANDVQIKVEAISNDSVAYYNKLSTVFAADKGPDIFLLSPSDFLRYANNDLLVDLRPYLKQEAIDDFYPKIMGTRLVGNKILGLPMEVEPMAMYYSVKAFEEAGLSETDIPKTYDELIEVAKKLTKPDRFGALFETTPGGYQVFTWYPFLWMGGGDVTDEEGKHSKFNQKGTVSALKLWKDLVEADAAPRECLGGGAWNVPANLGAGYCAMQNCGIWGLSQMRDQAPNFKFGVFKLPPPPGGEPISVAGGWAFVANSRGQNVDAAARFIAWAIGSPENESKQRVLNWCTQAKSDMSPRSSVTKLATDNGPFGAGPMKVFAEEILPTVRGEPRTPPSVWQMITDAIQSCMLNNQDPEEVAKSTNDKIETFLASYKGAKIL